MKLYYNPASTNSRLPHSVALQLGTKVDLQLVDFTKGEHKAPEYLKLNPNGKIPTLVDGELKLWEGLAIASYFGEQAPKTSFYPTDTRGRVEVLRWASWRLAHFGPAVSGIVNENVFKPLFFKQTPDQAKIDHNTEQFHLFAPVLNAHLETRKWINNDEMTIADFILGCPMSYAQAAKVPVERYTHILAWWDRLNQVDAWKKTAPKV